MKKIFSLITMFSIGAFANLTPVALPDFEISHSNRQIGWNALYLCSLFKENIPLFDEIKSLSELAKLKCDSKQSQLKAIHFFEFNCDSTGPQLIYESNISGIYTCK